MSESNMILPGKSIGMLGGGQLGRMSILAGRRLGYRFHVLESKEGCPAGMVADSQIVAAYTDRGALKQLGSIVDVVTLEFENIPSDAVDSLAEQVPVHPRSQVLHICQNRLREKTFLRDSGIPCAPFRVVRSADELRDAVRQLETPCVLKTADFGYDGKGQQKLEGSEDLEFIWAEAGVDTAVVEKWISFEGEYSAICARNARGESSTFPVAHNIHRNHILHSSTVPCGLSVQQEKEAQALARKIAEKLDVVGLIAVELFLTRDGWLVNEMAPRPHNSGHYSFDACLTSQFEQHIRAVCNLPLGDTRLLRPVCMVNLLGDLWKKQTPDWGRLLSDPEVKLHLYDKGDSRPGRKMGHFCVFGDSALDAQLRADQYFGQL